MELRERLRLAREQLAWTQQEAGERAGVSANMIYMYEAGQRRPSTLALKGLASLYGRSVEWFYGEEEEDQPALLTEEERAEIAADWDLIMNEASLALRSASPHLSDEAIRSIASYIRFVHEREEREQRERQDPG